MKMRRLGLVASLLIAVSIMTSGTSLAGDLFDKVYQNDIEGVKKLLAAGADINEKTEVGGAGTVTPLYIACNYYEDMAKLLISEGADVNSKTSKGETPLMAACYLSEEVARLLIAKGANVNAKAKDGSTPLSLATKENDQEMVKLLKSLGAK